ncbi:hypothetical protein [Fulvivirga ligni]|uniref:hypothetical protein n=1 Tax=Fulvivirga ligni TaxID=2904246 RepID=UPI001F1AABBF|nr:hypothetical protein [Fulvivirga ligni]UII19270.1 hypothetical protein LVD16_15605 [Fulvivirga ligni]
MKLSEDLKSRIFDVILGSATLKDFEQWVYQQEDLLERINEDFYLFLFAFNYGQPNAFREFTKMVNRYFGDVKWDSKP